MTVSLSLQELPGSAGRDLGLSDWINIDQKRIDLFAEATDDHQWIHVDPERARTGPFGGTIAHGYLTLSLVIPLWTDLLDVSDASTKVNYGLDRVRFPAPVPAGSRIRLAARITEVEGINGGAGFQITADLTVEIENSAKPACVARPVFRFYR